MFLYKSSMYSTKFHTSNFIFLFLYICKFFLWIEEATQANEHKNAATFSEQDEI